MVIPANAKYQIIHEMMQRDDNRLSVKCLCIMYPKGWTDGPADKNLDS